MWAVWLVWVGLDGGLMQAFQEVTNLRLFRSNNRVSVFLLAFALLFGARLLSSVRRRAVFRVACLTCLAWGLLDQVPGTQVDANAPHWETVAERERLAEADEKLVAEAERRLPEGGLVFELPAMVFPEAGYIGRTPDYDPFRPYLFSRHLHFSYGNMKGRPEYEWQQQVAAMNDDDRLAELKKKGFLALYVLKNAFPPGEVDRLLGSLRAHGHTEVLESEAGDSCFVLLKW